MPAAGASFDWRAALLRGDAAAADHATLERLAGTAPLGARGLLFLPYLLGERSPHWNPAARGAFIGLSMAHGRAEVVRAVLEGVAMNLRVILDAFRAQGAPISTLRVLGGGARSATWRQILADVLGVPLVRVRLTTEGTAMGAAIAGGVGSGLYSGYNVAADLVGVEPGEEPRAEAAAGYSGLYEAFCAAYDALVPPTAAWRACRPGSGLRAPQARHCVEP
jgi:sugar (pentulose or hexulose) kinase